MNHTIMKSNSGNSHSPAQITTTPPLPLTETSLPFSFYPFIFLESLNFHGCGSYPSLLKYPEFCLECVPELS